VSIAAVQLQGAIPLLRRLSVDGREMLARLIVDKRAGA